MTDIPTRAIKISQEMDFQGEYNYCIMALQLNYIDVCFMDFFPTSQRESYASASTPYIYNEVYLFGKFVSEQKTANFILQTFDFNVYLAIFSIFFLWSWIYFYVYKISSMDYYFNLFFSMFQGYYNIRNQYFQDQERNRSFIAFNIVYSAFCYIIYILFISILLLYICELEKKSYPSMNSLVEVIKENKVCNLSNQQMITETILLNAGLEQYKDNMLYYPVNVFEGYLNGDCDYFINTKQLIRTQAFANNRCDYMPIEYLYSTPLGFFYKSGLNNTVSNLINNTIDYLSINGYVAIYLEQYWNLTSEISCTDIDLKTRKFNQLHEYDVYSTMIILSTMFILGTFFYYKETNEYTENQDIYKLQDEIDNIDSMAEGHTNLSELNKCIKLSNANFKMAMRLYISKIDQIE